MHVVVSKEALARGMQAVGRAVSSRGPLPILTHVKLVADPDALRGADGEDGPRGALVLTATDLEIGLLARVPAEVREPGAIALQAKTLGEIIECRTNACRYGAPLHAVKRVPSFTAPVLSPTSPRSLATSPQRLVFLTNDSTATDVAGSTSRGPLMQGELLVRCAGGCDGGRRLTSVRRR